MLTINNLAKPVSVDNIYLFSSGIKYLLLAISRFSVYRLIINNPFKLKIKESPDESILNIIARMSIIVFRSGIWVSTAVGRCMGIGFVFFLPGIIVGYYAYMEFFYGKALVYEFNLPLLSIFVLTISEISTTTICG